MNQPLEQIFERHRAAFAREPSPSYRVRLGWLRELERTILANQESMLAALEADFGGRSRHESKFLDIYAPLSSIRYAKTHLRSWMAPRRRSTGLLFFPGRAEERAQPKGVVAILAPWNYPFYLALSPLAAALAAGNRVLLKPSESAPHCAALMQRMLAEVFDEDLVATLVGDVELAKALVSLPLDHLFYTGSAAAAASILRAAAEYLTPVTLELGGKSPAIVHPDYPVARAAKRIGMGKFANGGQTCVAPDYVLVHAAKRDELAVAILAELRRAYPRVTGNSDYTAIIDERHALRLRELVEDAVGRGATALGTDGDEDGRDDAAVDRRMAPVLLVGVNDDMRVMHEEIFGPILPLVCYERLDEAIAYVNARPRPLALYYFDRDRARAERVLSQTTSGGACVNEAALHVLDPDLAFGGVGESGMGAYHGQAGFETFSHRKSVLYRGWPNTADWLSPPYGKLFERVVRSLIGSPRA